MVVWGIARSGGGGGEEGGYLDGGVGGVGELLRHEEERLGEEDGIGIVMGDEDAAGGRG